MMNTYQLFVFLLILTPEVLSQDCRTDLPLDCSKEVTSRYRTFDGTCNNIGRDGDESKPFWGKAVACFERLVPPEFGDYSGYILRKSKKNGQLLPNPRSISNALMSDKPKVSDKFSQMLMNWGQVLGNEITYPTGVEDITYPCCDDHNYKNILFSCNFFE